MSGVQGTNRLASPFETAERSDLVHVPSLTIDEFCAQQNIRPDVIKIDVEGAELAVLAGARNTIEAGRERLALFVEMHATRWPEFGVTQADVLAELERHRLTAISIDSSVGPWDLEGVCVRLVPDRSRTETQEKCES